jgi:thiamine-monophosphate kinase
VVDAGDDAAVLRLTPGHDLVATTDAFVENVHFRREWLDPTGIGARLAAANLSDLAAMAATPRWALLSMGIRGDHPAASLIDVQRGLAAALEPHGAVITGGNLTRVEGGEWFDLTLLGEAAPGEAWTRGGARPGDWIAITGHPGRAGAGCRVAMALGDAARAAPFASLIDAWLRPTPRIDLARALAGRGCVTGAIDVSDGFGADLGRLCAASRVGARVEDALWPRDPALAAGAVALRVEADALRFGPSDDYELLLAVNPARRAEAEALAGERGVPLCFVGRFTESPARVWIDGNGAETPLPDGGWDHFGAR